MLILTTFDLDEYAFAGLHAGASGFLLKNSRPEELLAASAAWPQATRWSPRGSPADGKKVKAGEWAKSANCAR